MQLLWHSVLPFGFGLVITQTQQTNGLSFWLTQLQPATHCPQTLSRSTWEQLAADMGHFNTFGDMLIRRAQIRAEWDAFCERHPEHPTVRAVQEIVVSRIDDDCL